ncbi:MMPL family transporter [Actinomadura sp. HBU206391]|uniref:MMPL family transporter n=1 Tax=Actinomadura sp. HBU206391 TaxID=2731692 RepID=UPI0016500FC4|nr:MMPL family transporter [Actinomadura sp. HBU206391]MBC6460256.1 MMPL family transporter [Actinomadura sp. HBU206391]
MGDRPSSPLTRLAGFCYRRRRLTVLLWIVGAAAAIVAGAGFPSSAANEFEGGRSESARAQRLLDRHFPGQGGESITLAVRAERGVDDPAARVRVERLVAAIGRTPHVTGIVSPYLVPGQISPDRRTAFASAGLDVVADDMPTGSVTKLIEAAHAESGDGVRLALAGPAVDVAETPDGGSEGFGLLAAVVVLLVAFGSVLAMCLPIATALFGIGTGLAGTELLGHVLPAPSFGPIVAGLIGLGVGVDYALFIVTRYREALAGGADPREATVTAIGTSGRAVLFAGTSVVVALLGLLVMRQRLLTGVAVASGTTVLMTMIASITLLPALFGFTGRGIDRLRVPRLGRAGRPLVDRWAGAVQRRPLVAASAAATVLLVLAAPAVAMRLSFPDSSTQPRHTSGYAAHRILADGFGPGYAAPLVFVAQGGDAGPVVEAVRRTRGVAAATPPRVSDDGTATIFIAYPATGAQDSATPELVHRLRDEVVPRATAGTDLRVHVGGPNAALTDFADDVRSRLPWLIAVVVGLSLALLVPLVRSPVIAVKAAVMNILSIGAAYGVLVAVVQWGWLGGLLGFPTTMPVTAWVPLFVFPVLFGLSMDYEVFLISRIREEYERLGDTRQAVTRGLEQTARVITAAAAIMVMVFLSVLLGAEVAVKQVGLGLGVAVFIDATIVRMVLVPAVMELLGGANWWLPAWLERLLPRHDPEAGSPVEPVAVSAK